MKIIETVRLIVKQGLAFRGHDESLTSNNRGNFQEILKHMSKYDEELTFKFLLLNLAIFNFENKIYKKLNQIFFPSLPSFNTSPSPLSI